MFGEKTQGILLSRRTRKEYPHNKAWSSETRVKCSSEKLSDLLLEKKDGNSSDIPLLLVVHLKFPQYVRLVWSKRGDEPGNGNEVCLLLSDHIKVREFWDEPIAASRLAVTTRTSSLCFIIYRACGSGTILSRFKRLGKLSVGCASS